jgi:hypothetical protein
VTAFFIILGNSFLPTRPAFSQIVNRGKVDKDGELCECVRDIDENGLAKYLQLTAFQIRYPGITSGNHTITDTCINKLDITTTPPPTLVSTNFI